MQQQNILAKIFIVITVFFMFGCSSPQNEAMSTNQAYKAGLIYLKNNNTLKAKESFLIAIQDKNNSKAPAMLAILLLDEKSNSSTQEIEQSYQFLQSSLQHDEPLAYLGMYYYYKKKNDSKLSELWLNKSVDKNVSIANYLKAKQLLEKNDNDVKGVALLRKAATQNYMPAQANLVLRSLSSKNKVETYIWTTIIKQKISYSDKMYKINEQLKEQVIQELTEQQKADADNQIATILNEIETQEQKLF